ncbi:Hypothetical_protein [Hexamita inflata]|uniref:Hypothetical_protein n=1 Tax=Hexamita inflata TaxID=28002 RepID=A0AA86R2C0_9EUKA|nr:Hypothetical protein HINF_LOCUS33671 [Hexamita inflata]CAI9967867.1 Hypothetical protein HINF_LOCUS55512 [Hexamita inflata]
MQFYAMNLNISIISDPVSPKQRSINCTSSKLTFNLQASAFQEKSTRQNFLSRKWGTINEAHPELMNNSQFCRNQLKILKFHIKTSRPILGTPGKIVENGSIVDRNSIEI